MSIKNQALTIRITSIVILGAMTALCKYMPPDWVVPAAASLGWVAHSVMVAIDEVERERQEREAKS